MKILVLGQGGREHALGWRMKRDGHQIFFAPGNGGTCKIGTNIGIGINPENSEEVKRICREQKIDFVVVGPEAPLESGIIDELEKSKIPAFGPRKDAAIIETSKAVAKEIMRESGIPTPEFEIFSSSEEAKKFLKSKKNSPFVIKASGLCAGKGAFVCFSQDEGFKALEKIKEFGKAGETIVIEDFIEGREVSFFAFACGKSSKSIGFARDYKRALDGDKGVNTGGMGSYSPCEYVEEQTRVTVEESIIKPLLYKLEKMGIVYQGVVYAGLMLKDGKPYVLEFNARFGDPEAQVILPLINGDFTQLLISVYEQKLEDAQIKISDQYAVCVVAAPQGYPDKYVKGKIIYGVEEREREEEKTIVFHAGTKLERQGEVVTAGGRVLGVTGLGNTKEEARGNAYKRISTIYFDGMFFRRDIAS